MGLEFKYHKGQTPISDEEKDGLKINTITSHAELNELEQLNIEKAIEWTINSKFSPDKILTIGFIKKVHKKMLSDVWRWAGVFRKTEKNIGVEWYKIDMELRYLLDDTKYWIENNTYSPEEIAIRFKHRLVRIHCFPNGNGRHSRILADIIIVSIFGGKVYSWNQSNMVELNKTRMKYISALMEADNGNINPLIDFAKN